MIRKPASSQPTRDRVDKNVYPTRAKGSNPKRGTRSVMPKKVSTTAPKSDYAP